MNTRRGSVSGVFVFFAALAMGLFTGLGGAQQDINEVVQRQNNEEERNQLLLESQTQSSAQGPAAKESGPITTIVATFSDDTGLISILMEKMLEKETLKLVGGESWRSLSEELSLKPREVSGVFDRIIASVPTQGDSSASKLYKTAEALNKGHSKKVVASDYYWLSEEDITAAKRESVFKFNGDE